MNTRQRLVLISLLEKMDAHKDFCKEIGITDTSKYGKHTIKGDVPSGAPPIIVEYNLADQQR